MGRADLHIHTTYSDGMGTVTAMLEAARRADLDVVAITDHNSTAGVSEALDRGPDYGLEVVPGCEITTNRGHLLGLFIDRPVPAGRSLRETVLRIADLGGLAVAAHPMASWLCSFRLRDLQEAIDDPLLRRTFVGLEVFNAGLPYMRNNVRAQAFANTTQLAQLGGSDSHLLWTVGMGATQFAGTTAEHLRRALESGCTAAIASERPLRFFTSWARSKILRWAGLAYWNAEPGHEALLCRLSRVEGLSSAEG
jgi:predicted metal-dependent phosphoesterase TrpH